MVKSNTLFVLKDVISQIHIDEEDVMDIVVNSKHIHLFDDVKDFRDETKTKYDLADILLMAFIVMMEKGKQSFYYMSLYVEFNKQRFEKYGLIKDDNIPSHDTFRRVFCLLDSDSLIETTIERFYKLLVSMEKEKGLRPIGVDGKTINGTGRSDNTNNPSRNINVLNIYDVNTGTCLKSEVVDTKTNEIPVAQTLLSKMNLKNDLVMADALHCQAETTKAIRHSGGHYLLCVRENQKTLYEDVVSRFNNKKNQKTIKTVNQEDKKKTIEIFKLPKGFEYEGFKDIRSYVKMTSSKKNRECVRYYISDLIKADEILLGIDEHWAIENDLHKLKDDYLNEDSFRCIDKKAIQNIAIMNNLIVQLVYIYLPFSGYDLHKVKIALSCDPYKEISKLLAVLSSDKIVDKLRVMMKDKNRKRK